jgi:hypothetical protein
MVADGSPLPRAMAENRGMQISQPNTSSLPAPATAAVRGAQASAGAEAARGVTPPPPAPDAAVARLDAFGAGLTSRIDAAFAGASAEDKAALGSVLEGFGQNLGRIRAGIEDGSLSGDKLAQAIQSTLGAVRDELGSAREATAARDAEGATGPNTAAAAAVDADAVATRVAAARTQGAAEAATTPQASAQARVQSVIGGLSQRLDGLRAQQGTPEDGPDALAQAQRAFESAASRIETAFFEGKDFDRGTFYGLMSASLGRLQQRVSDVVSGSQVQDATLYDVKRGTESLSEGLRRVQFDRTV